MPSLVDNAFSYEGERFSFSRQNMRNLHSLPNFINLVEGLIRLKVSAHQLMVLFVSFCLTVRAAELCRAFLTLHCSLLSLRCWVGLGEW